MSTFLNYPNNANTYLPGVIFIPSTLIITAITQSNPMQITFTVPTTGANTYQAGQRIKLNIPFSYGMQQANGLTPIIINVLTNTLTVALDSTLFDPFAIPPSGAEAPASFAPSGSKNLQFDNTTNQVPFQPLNNVGN